MIKQDIVLFTDCAKPLSLLHFLEKSCIATRTKNSKDVKFLEFLLITYYLFTLH